MTDNDNPEQPPYGASPAMVAVKLMQQFNALPPEQRRQAIRYSMLHDMLEQAQCNECAMDAQNSSLANHID